MNKFPRISKQPEKCANSAFFPCLLKKNTNCEQCYVTLKCLVSILNAQTVGFK